MKKNILMLMIVFLPLPVFSKNEKKTEEPKIYTQTEFNEKLEKLLFEKLKRFGSDNMVGLSHELYEKEKGLELKENQIKNREEQVVVTEKELMKKIKELQSKEEKIISCLDDHDGKEKKRIDHMVDAISGMRPQNAADVLSVQDPDLSVRILDRLPASKVSKIFNSMKKEISARLQKQYMNMEK